MAVNFPKTREVHPVRGLRLGVARANIRKPDRRDLVVMTFDKDATVAAVFTTNRFRAAPVLVAEEHLRQIVPRALVINTGFANAGTGSQGVADARQTCDALGRLLGVSPQEVLPFSTGVIGERFPLDRIVAGLPLALSALTVDGWQEAAHGIMTTDTLPKLVSRQVTIGGKPVAVTGIAKGAGMICPNMATMLSFIGTDARVDRVTLDALLRHAVSGSFNRITVDGDTSTNDACVLVATGASGAAVPGADSAEAQVLGKAIDEVLRALAQMIIRDAEGATKFMTIEVVDGASEQDCLEAAYAVAHSPLVKTAFFASDPNWGRILAAVGRARLSRLDVDKVSVSLNGVTIVSHGGRDPGYTEKQGVAVMAEAEIVVRISLGTGQSSATVWTSDLSHDYVKINAEYRT